MSLLHKYGTFPPGVQGGVRESSQESGAAPRPARCMSFEERGRASLTSVTDVRAAGPSSLKQGSWCSTLFLQKRKKDVVSSDLTTFPLFSWFHLLLFIVCFQAVDDAATCCFSLAASRARWASSSVTPPPAVLPSSTQTMSTRVRITASPFLSHTMSLAPLSGIYFIPPCVPSSLQAL